MNRIFKSIFNHIQGCFVVCHESKMTRGKSAKALCLSTLGAVLAAIGSAETAQAAYVEQGFVAQNVSQLEAAKKSWESNEYLRGNIWNIFRKEHGDWGLEAIHASTAYAMGFHGQGVKVGVMDSGIAISHSEFQGGRYHTVTTTGKYSSSDTRYQNGGGPKNSVYDNFEEGEAFSIGGEYILGVNDGHGTHVSGTIGANRDGVGMHGVAWGSEIYVANTGGMDMMTEGPNQDYGYYKAAYETLARQGVRIINQSWGNYGKFPWDPKLPDLKELEKAWFYYDQYRHKTFIDAAVETAVQNKIIFVRAGGNNSEATPFTSASLPYFRPEAEDYWMAVCATDSKGELPDFTAKAGYAKWWTVAAPGDMIKSTVVNDETGAVDGPKEPLYRLASGTSMAAPYATGTLAVVMSRYPYMTNVQAKNTLLTTATQTLGGRDITQVPDEKIGWGFVNLETAMYGPGQFLGVMDVSMNTGLDVWSNNITNAALDERKLEDAAEAKEWEERKQVLEAKTTLTADEKSEYEYKSAREEARKTRVYEGSLIKHGSGTLVLTGNNTYRGGTTVEEGTLLGFAHSFGVNGEDDSVNGRVVVNGGTFGVISQYDNRFPLPRNPSVQSKVKVVASGHSVDVTMNKGGTYAIAAGQDVDVGTLTFKEGSKISIVASDPAGWVSAYEGNTLSGSVMADRVEGGKWVAEVPDSPDYAFFETRLLTFDPAAKKISGELRRTKDVTFATYATTDNGRAIGNAIESAKTGALFERLLSATKDEVPPTYETLGSDAFLNAQNTTVINTLTMTRTIQDVANGSEDGKTVDFADGTGRIWATGVASWGNLDYGQTQIDNDFYAGFFGAELKVSDSTKLGAFFGAGTSDFDGGAYGKIESDDVHFGLYGVSTVGEAAAINYGLTFTHQDRDHKRILTVVGNVGANAFNADADIVQLFAEGAYTGFNTESYSIEPYAGFNWIHVKADDFTEMVGDLTFKTDNRTQNLQVTTLGVRGEIPFTVGSVPVAVKGSLAWMHFFGDTEAQARMHLSGSGVAALRGGELKDAANVGLGVEAQLTKTSTFGLSCTGTYDGDVTASGLTANLRIVF